MTNIIYAFIIIFCAYLIGSFPTGYILVKVLKGQDIRQVGSGSTGATNVKRVLGKYGFFSVMILDAIKGFLPVIISQYIATRYNIYTNIGLLPVLAAIGVIFGHSKSVFLGFTGGKSVATTAGTIIALNPLIAAVCFGTWAVIAYFSKYISLASIVAMIMLPILMFFAKTSVSCEIYCIIAAFYVIYLHRENIKRLVNGTENKVR